MLLTSSFLATCLICFLSSFSFCLRSYVQQFSSHTAKAVPVQTMEALAAVSLAGNVLQFIQYAGQLISTGNEIYTSTSGSSERNSELEKVYKTLDNFAVSLQNETAQQSHQTTAPGHSADTYCTENLEHLRALNTLSRDCKEVCNQLLEKVRKLKVEDGRWRRCKSFRAALDAAWGGRSLSDLESRLDRFQRVILLHFFPIIRYSL